MQKMKREYITPRVSCNNYVCNCMLAASTPTRSAIDSNNQHTEGSKKDWENIWE